MSKSGYAFIYDDQLEGRRYEREVSAVEARLTTLELYGRKESLSLFRSAKQIVDHAMRHGVSTIVIVGSDRTLDKVMWFLPDLNVTVGYIPVFPPFEVGALLGIPMGADACDVLAARLVETIDVGRCEDRYFLTEVKIINTIASLDIEGQYRLTPIMGGSINVKNLAGDFHLGKAPCDAQDGRLEAVITPRLYGARFFRPTYRNFPFRQFSSAQATETMVLFKNGEIISSDPIDVLVDNHVVNGFRFRLDIVPKKLKLVTGRERKLSAAAETVASNKYQSAARIDALNSMG